MIETINQNNLKIIPGLSDGIIVAKNSSHKTPEVLDTEDFNDDVQKNNNVSIDQLLEGLNSNVQKFQETLEFSFDDDKKRFNFVLRDISTGDIIRKYPTDDIVKLDKQVNRILGSIIDKDI